MQTHKSTVDSTITLLVLGDFASKRHLYDSVRNSTPKAIEIITPGITELICPSFYGKAPLRFVDCERQIRSHSWKKYFHMFNEVTSVVMCIDVINKPGSEDESVHHYLKVFRKVMHSKWLRKVPLILVFYSSSRDDSISKLNGVSSIRFSSFKNEIRTDQTARTVQIGDRFLARNRIPARSLYKYTTEPEDKYFSLIFSEMVRDILVSALVERIF